MDAEDEILMMGYLLLRKRRNHQQRKQWLKKYCRCIISCHSLYHSILCLLFYQAQKFTNFCLFIHFRWIDVKSSKCFSGLSFIRSSHQKCYIVKGVLRNFAKFIGQFLCKSLFFNKVAGLSHFFVVSLSYHKEVWKPCNFIKKRDSGTLDFL